MPGPFPGMDPYLEAPENWRGVHAKLITYLTDQLNALLPAPFAAVSEERAYILQDEREVVPDFAIVRPYEPPMPISQGGVAVLERPEISTAFEEDISPVEVVDRYINILAVRERELITTIEVLSPVNKRGEGREKYLEKQRAVLASDVHLLEIDLLRTGEHTIAVPMEKIIRRGQPYTYLACLRRAPNRSKLLWWPIPLRERLPVLSVPLTSEFADVPLDLQAALDTVYDRGNYARLIDYDYPCVPALSAADAAWAAKQVHL